MSIESGHSLTGRPGQVGMSDDGLEKIVEVVGNTPGQLAYGLHLLGVAQLGPAPEPGELDGRSP
jgi:hypothetical protein